MADEDAGEGNGYAYHVRYPPLGPEWSTLADALRTYAAARKKEFLDARLADETTNAAPYTLDLEFNVARRTSDFVSVLANGSIFTGGAHPAPLIASFNLHTPDGKLIELADLFADSRVALDAMSANASGPPRYAACVRPQAEYHPIPVASLTASYSATIAVAAAKSPHHAA